MSEHRAYIRAQIAKMRRLTEAERADLRTLLLPGAETLRSAASPAVRLTDRRAA